MRRLPFLLTHPPVSCRQVLEGPAAYGPREESRGFGCGTRCAFSRTRQCLRTGTASPRGRQVIGSHLWATFLCEQKSDSRTGRREKRLSNLAVANMSEVTKKQTGETPHRVRRIVAPAKTSDATRLIKFETARSKIEAKNHQQPSVAGVRVPIELMDIVPHRSLAWLPCGVAVMV